MEATSDRDRNSWLERCLDEFVAIEIHECDLAMRKLIGEPGLVLSLLESHGQSRAGNCGGGN